MVLHVQWNLSNPTNQGNTSDFTGCQNILVSVLVDEQI